jgi:two-component system response regulator HydG
MTKILIVDDDPMFRIMLRTFLLKNNYDISEASNGKDCLRKIKAEAYDVILTDLRLPDTTGLDLLDEIKESDYNKNVPVILMTSFGDIKSAVKAMKLGAYEYVTKPVNPDEILMNIRGALKRNYVLQATEGDEGGTSVHGNFEYVNGTTEAAERIREFIALVAPTRMSVLIEGESGTGKEFVAKMIHQMSKRKDTPFVAVDCGTLSRDLAGSELFGHVKGAFTGAMQDKKGQFHEADNGTLFLDEVGNLPYEVQVKLLRALQERKVRQIGSNIDQEVNVRIIAATNEDLQIAVEEGRFREDLYHRLNEFSIAVPPLRERKDDIITFAEYFLNQANQELEKDIIGFSSEVLTVFLKYSWPGNFRELKNIVKRSTLLARGDMIDLTDLPEDLVRQAHKLEESGVTVQHTDIKAVHEKNEKELIKQVLVQTNYNKSKAARILNIDRKTLYNKLKLYSIEI